ncbi:hypothetical protein CBS101457_001730 [Exobasidium rhododendri]|nr:hypothetical protein CBS101457_001730 [Exobasidium rhododendri]
MTESEDPWADHVRGKTPTPLEEGDDPLSLGALSPLTGEKAIPANRVKAKALERQHRDSLEAQWGAGLVEGTASQDVHVQGPAPGKSSSSALSPGRMSSKAMEAHAEKRTDSSDDHEEDDVDDDDDDEAFVYPGGPSVLEEVEPTAPGKQSMPTSDLERTSLADIPLPPAEAKYTGTEPPPNTLAKPVDFVQLSLLCSQGPLNSVQNFFSETTSLGPAGYNLSTFSLANIPNPANGLVPIHYAAREGRVEILKWLVEEAGALVEMEDREGETALHKASLAGKLPALTYLLSSGAEANCVDADGWTPLHNACSRGYLDIVKVLVEKNASLINVKGGRGGWTSLMSAASHGFLPIVRYLTSKQQADPFVRNEAGETAYDVAAATFEIYICEILERYENERWAALNFATATEDSSMADNATNTTRLRPSRGVYNPLALHTTIPVVLHENQRLDTRLSTLALRGGRPRWSGTQAGRPDKSDRRAPGTMPPGPLSLSRTRNIPMRREDVLLPTRREPYKVRLSNRSTRIATARRARGEVVPDEMGTTPTPDSVLNRANNGRGSSSVPVEAEGDVAHFWLSEWQTDLTHPQVDAEQGWQYSQSFDTPDERWLASPPPPLVRLLEGRGGGLSHTVQRAVTGVVQATSGPVEEAEAVQTGWVRRRRWIRVMKRRLDIEFKDELEAAEEASSHLTTSQRHDNRECGLTFAYIIEAQQAARMDAQKLGPTADYLARSKAMAGTSSGFTPADVVDQSDTEMKRHITRLDVAILELRNSAFSDDDRDRQMQAEETLKEFTLQVGQLKQAAGLQEGSEEEDDDDDDDDDEFIYPNSYKDDGQSVITRIGTPSVTNNGIVPPRQRSTPSEAGTSMGAIRSADLANARDFRVPTNEVPNRPIINAHRGLREQVLLPSWETDGDVVQCRDCSRKFTFFLRKHHCRRCGRIYCDACSNHRAILSPDELVIDPSLPEMLFLESSGPTRICNSCDAELQLPSSLRNARGVDVLSEAVDRLDLGVDTSCISNVSSRASELNDCPVCETVLADLGNQILQEEHVQRCLENGGGGGDVQGSRYLIYKLAEGPIVGKECQICLEDLCVGMTIARLPCLCYYHRHWKPLRHSALILGLVEVGLARSMHAPGRKRRTKEDVASA